MFGHGRSQILLEFVWNLITASLCNSSRNQGGGNVVMWACMTSYGFWYVCEVYDDKMTALDYIRI